MPEYSTQNYWDNRFDQDVEPFEWLKKPEDLLPYVRDLISDTPQVDRRILHIGPGSSALSLRLRELVSRPCDVHNVDFSQRAIELGRQMEKIDVEAWNAGPKLDSNDLFMTWTQVNLLDNLDVQSLSAERRDQPLYSLVIDKSTSDSVACGREVVISETVFDIPSQPVGHSTELAIRATSFRLPPVWLLSLHLAVVTAPAAQWLCVTYSEDRFLFLGDAAQPFELNGRRVPVELLPICYWTIEPKDALVSKSRPSPNTDGLIVPRPDEVHWMFTLRRTERRLGFNLKS